MKVGATISHVATPLSLTHKLEAWSNSLFSKKSKFTLFLNYSLSTLIHKVPLD